MTCLCCYNDHLLTRDILKSANAQPEFYQFTIKLINQYNYNVNYSKEVPHTYRDFNAILPRRAYNLSIRELATFIEMIKENPLLKELYHVTSEFRIKKNDHSGIAKSNLLLQSEAFKLETKELFYRIRAVYTVENSLSEITELKLPSKTNECKMVTIGKKGA
jgi:hypothetical protein